MKKWIGNLILWALGSMAVIGLATIVISMIIGEMDYQQIKYISLSGE